MKRNNQLLGSGLLLLCAVIWGSSFASQTVGAQYIGPFTFMSVRSFLGSAVLLPVIGVGTAWKRKRGFSASPDSAQRKTLLLGGLCCGAVLAVASFLQQLGIDRGTSSGKAGFITALYILLVPIFSVVLKKKIRPLIWLCVAIALAGLYLLCVKETGVQRSDFYVLLCAASYAVHILVIDHFSPHVDGIRLSCLQFFVTGVLCLIPMLIFEPVSLQALKNAAPALAYSGIMSSGVAYTLQILGQQRTEPTLASLLMSLESVFAVLTGMLVLHEIPTAREAWGCVLMFAAVVAAQLPQKKKTESQNADANQNERAE